MCSESRPANYQIPKNFHVPEEEEARLQREHQLDLQAQDVSSIHVLHATLHECSGTESVLGCHEIRCMTCEQWLWHCEIFQCVINLKITSGSIPLTHLVNKIFTVYTAHLKEHAHWRVSLSYGTFWYAQQREIVKIIFKAYFGVDPISQVNFVSDIVCLLTWGGKMWGTRHSS